MFNGAVIVSSWLGGLGAGIASTILSAALVWWFLVPPERALGAADPRYLLTVAIFLAIGTAVSLLHENLRRARRALAATTNELEEAQRLAHIGNWTWDLRTKTGWWSPELYRIHHRDPSLPLPGPDELRQFFTPESAAAIRVAVEKMMQEGTPFELELEAVFPGRSELLGRDARRAVRDSSGKFVGLRGTSQDITRLKTLERLKEEWTSVVAHDLRQPIGVITMSAEMLPDLHPGDLTEPESATVHHIRSAARSLNRMVNDLLDVSRLEAHRLSLERGWHDPAQLVHETLERLRHLTPQRDVTVSIEGALAARVRGPRSLRTDPRQPVEQRGEVRRSKEWDSRSPGADRRRREVRRRESGERHPEGRALADLHPVRPNERTHAAAAWRGSVWVSTSRAAWSKRTAGTCGPRACRATRRRSVFHFPATTAPKRRRDVVRRGSALLDVAEACEALLRSRRAPLGA